MFGIYSHRVIAGGVMRCENPTHSWNKVFLLIDCGDVCLVCLFADYLNEWRVISKVQR
jgi:hypothetical protein